MVGFLALAFAFAQAGAQETRDLEPFTGIGVAISADVSYTTGNAYSITIEGNERDVEDLITEVEGGKLKVKYENNWRVKRSKLTIHIISRELDHISLSGSADILVEKVLSAEEFRLAISGSGTVTIPGLECEELDVHISGSGTSTIKKGNAEEMDVKISGSGKLQAEDLAVEEFSVSISGSGSVRVTVKDELEARIAGSGSVYYHGNPVVNSSSSGSGKVRSLD